MEWGEGREKINPEMLLVFFLSLTKQLYVVYLSHMCVKSGCTECLRNNNGNCVGEGDMCSLLLCGLNSILLFGSFKKHMMVKKLQSSVYLCSSLS